MSQVEYRGWERDDGWGGGGGVRRGGARGRRPHVTRQQALPVTSSVAAEAINPPPGGAGEWGRLSPPPPGPDEITATGGRLSPCSQQIDSTLHGKRRHLMISWPRGTAPADEVTGPRPWLPRSARRLFARVSGQPAISTKQAPQLLALQPSGTKEVAVSEGQSYLFHSCCTFSCPLI